MTQRSDESKHLQRYFVFSEDELFFLIICVILDVSEYVFAILLLPVVGDLLDLIGIIVSFVMFRWFGIISLFELVPGVDVLPVFLITWLIWYLAKKRRK